jgi:hypothetical protein
MNAKVCFIYTEFPALQWVAIALGGVVRYIKLETRPVKAGRLADGFDVGGLQSEKNTQPTKHVFLALTGGYEGLFKRR